MFIASNRRKTKELESVAELKLAERMANGEVEYKKAVIDSYKGDLKMVLPHPYSPSFCFWLGLCLVMTLTYNKR